MLNIIVTGNNCQIYADECVQSVLNQSYQNWNMFICSDGSTDKTNDILSKYTDSRINLFLMNQSLGAACRRWELIKQADDGIICLLDLDDKLNNNALLKILNEYDKGNICTYGNWYDQNGFIFPYSELFYNEEIKHTRDYRKDKWRFTHFKTFDKKLFNKIDINDFKVNGQWLQMTTESPLFAIYEMAGNRIGVISDPIYMYRRNLKTSVSTLHTHKDIHTYYDIICSRKKYDIL